MILRSLDRALARSTRRLAGILAFANLPSCSAGTDDSARHGTDQHIQVRESTSFNSRYCAVEAVRLEQSVDHVVASVQSISMDSDGRILVTDNSEGDVKLFGPAGQIVAVIGRKGGGPAEFLSPLGAHVTASGEIVVADSRLNRVQYFDDSGSLLRNIPLDVISDIRGFGTLSDGSMIFLTSRFGGEGHVLVHTDSNASVVASYLPLADIRPASEVDDPAWQWARNFSMVLVGDTAHVMASLVPILWAVDFQTGTVTSFRFDFAEYLAPKLPDRADGIRTAEDMMGWFFRRHLAGYPVVGGDAILLPFIRGWPYRLGATVDLLHKTVDGDWEFLTDGPMPIGINGPDLAVIADPATDDMRIVRYRRCAGVQQDAM